MQNERQEWLPLLPLFAIWLGAVLLVNPFGDFPLNDDFSYGKSVRNLAVDDKFLLDKWLAQTLAAQVFWGAAFCKAFGFSFTVLRFSTLLLGFAGVAASYFLCRELGQGRRLALLFALTVAFNPLFFSLSFTFMTDVPFFTFSILSTLFFIKALRSNSALGTPNSVLFWGAFFALAATFVRQIGLMLPVAFAVTWLCLRGFRWKSFPLAMLPATVIFAAFFGYNHWLEQGQGLPPGYGNFTRLARTFDDTGIFSRILPRTGILLAYLGAFFLPVSLVLAVGSNLSESFKLSERWATFKKNGLKKKHLPAAAV
ncbi:MAG: glycosyltransferase family 39 protein, partial [Bacteroidota bacterium]